jgi:hypothetical protein
MTESDVLLVEGALGVDLPVIYRSWLLRLPDVLSDEVEHHLWKTIGRVYATPEQIIDNTQRLIGTSWLADSEWSDVDVSDFIAIGDDVCGNYYVFDPDDDDAEVYYLIHDPEGLEELFPTLESFIETMDHFMPGEGNTPAGIATKKRVHIWDVILRFLPFKPR